MDEDFELPVEYKGQQLMLKTSLQVTGYTHRFVVEVRGQKVIFEPDEERNYRAIIPYEDISTRKDVDFELLKSIAAAIQQLVK
jgi:hypothetical protein